VIYTWGLVTPMLCPEIPAILPITLGTSLLLFNVEILLAVFTDGLFQWNVDVLVDKCGNPVFAVVDLSEWSNPFEKNI